jgi:hypothetical protein
VDLVQRCAHTHPGTRKLGEQPCDLLAFTNRLCARLEQPSLVIDPEWRHRG